MTVELSKLRNLRTKTRLYAGLWEHAEDIKKPKQRYSIGPPSDFGPCGAVEAMQNKNLSPLSPVCCISPRLRARFSAHVSTLCIIPNPSDM